MGLLKKLAAFTLSFLVATTSFISTRLYLNSQSFDYPRSVVHMVSNTKGGHGSGVMIAHNLMLTAFHVSGPEGKDLTVNGKPVKVLKFDSDLDVALLEVEQGCPCIPITSDVPAPDSEVLAVGFPLSVGQVATIGHAQGVVDKILISTAPTIFGNSGGGLFMWNWQDALFQFWNMQHWVLVGITVNIAGANLGFFGVPVAHLGGSVPSASIMKFIHGPVIFPGCEKDSDCV